MGKVSLATLALPAAPGCLMQCQMAVMTILRRKSYSPCWCPSVGGQRPKSSLGSKPARNRGQSNITGG